MFLRFINKHYLAINTNAQLRVIMPVSLGVETENRKVVSLVAVSIIQIIECTNVLCFTFRVTSILIKITSLDKEPLFGKRANGSRTWGTRNLKKKKPIDTLSDPRFI